MAARAAIQALKCEINERIAFTPSKELDAVDQDDDHERLEKPWHLWKKIGNSPFARYPNASASNSGSVSSTSSRPNTANALSSCSDWKRERPITSGIRHDVPLPQRVKQCSENCREIVPALPRVMQIGHVAGERRRCIQRIPDIRCPSSQAFEKHERDHGNRVAY